MMRALAIAAMLAGVIVACSFKGPAVGFGNGDGGLGDAAVRFEAGPPPVDTNPNPGIDASVMIDARPLDAPVDASKACSSTVCVAAGGTCNNGTCVIVGAGSPITCPPGMPCEVDCTAGGACQNGVSCGTATSCYIRCDGMNTCGGSGINCVGTDCVIDCVVNHACDNQAVLGSGSCTRHCCASNACTGSLGGCTTVQNGCM